MKNTITLTCTKCDISYEKPEIFIKYAKDDGPSGRYFRETLIYCDDCRREKVSKILNSPQFKHILDVLSDE